MTDAELRDFCRRHNVELAEAETAREIIESLRDAPPRGVSMPGDCVGDLMEATAHVYRAIKPDGPKWLRLSLDEGLLVNAALRVKDAIGT